MVAIWYVGAAAFPANNDVIDKALALFKCECYPVCDLTSHAWLIHDLLYMCSATSRS